MIYITSTAMVVFLCTTLVGVWYIRKLLQYIADVMEDVVSVSNVLNELKEHMSEVYNMERFYGDNTLENMLKHCDEVTEELQKFTLSVNELFETEKDDNEKEEEKK